MSIRAGTNFNDLQEVEVIDLNEPTGWVQIPTVDIRDRPIRTFMIQIAVISNHQNGRDTHMRQIKVCRYFFVKLYTMHILAEK